MSKSTQQEMAEAIGSNLSGVGTELLEQGIDAVLDEGILKDIPIVGSVVGLFKSGIAVRERLYVQSLLKFLAELDKTDKAQREKFLSEKLKDTESREKLGTTIFQLIDAADDQRKVILYARAIALAVNDKCSYNEAIRLCRMIQRAYASDFDAILGFSEQPQITGNSIELENLSKTGFLSTIGMDGGDMDDPDSGGTIYKINRYGILLRAVIEN